MKKLGLFFTLFCFYAIYALFIAVPSASAQCTPPDDSGLCPTGVQCPSGLCCPATTDCLPPSSNNIRCCEIGYRPERSGGKIVCNDYFPGGLDGLKIKCTGSTPICSSDINTCISEKEATDKGITISPGAATPTCDDGNGTPTALGCIPNEPAAAITKILPWAIRLGTGLAFLLFLYGAFTLITAGSDPQKVDTGKSIITSAAAGLIFIILSVILLRIIGIDILKL